MVFYCTGGRHGYFRFPARVEPKHRRLRLVATLADHRAGRSAFLSVRPEPGVPVPQFVVRDPAPVATHFERGCGLKTTNPD